MCPIKKETNNNKKLFWKIIKELNYQNKIETLFNGISS